MKIVNRHVLFFITAALLLNSCGHVGKLTKRYNILSDSMKSDSALKENVSVYAFVQPAEKPAAAASSLKTVFNFSPQGQQELIKRLASFDSSSAQLISDLKKPLEDQAEWRRPKFIDLTQFTKVITLTTKKNSLFDADRISAIDIAIKCNNKNVAFTGCDKIVTNYATADLGKLSLVQNRNAELNANFGGGFTGTTANQNVTGTNSGLTTGTTNGNSVTNGNPADLYSNSSNTSNGTSSSNTTGSSNTNTNGTTGQTNFTTGISGKLAASRTFSEEVGLRQRFVNLSAYFKNDELHFYQEGISGIDVSGNIISTVKLEFTGDITESTTFSFDNLFTKGVPNKPDTAYGNQVMYSFPNINGDIKFTVGYEGIFRKVDKWRSTISEADDKITLMHGKVMDTATKIVLLKNEEFTPRRWYLTLLNDEDKSTGMMEISGPDNSAELYSGPLFFDSYEKAMEFFQWLKVNFKAIKNNSFKIGPRERQYTLRMQNSGPLTERTISELHLRIFRG